MLLKRFISFLTLSALLLGLSHVGSLAGELTRTSANTYFKAEKNLQWVLVARDEQNKPTSFHSFGPQSTPATLVNVSLLRPTRACCRTTAVPRSLVFHFAPSLTGTIVIQV
ncbi:MAG: hypothetical protein QM790_03255 [Nibricoccus sp.]